MFGRSGRVVTWLKRVQFGTFNRSRRSGRDRVEREWMQIGYDMRTGAVCKICNNGWMSLLESRAQPTFEAMLRGHGRTLHQGGQRTLAAWAMKTALIVEHLHGAKRRVIPEDDCQHLFAQGEPSQRVLIWMATYRGTAAAMGRMFGLDADMALDPDPDRGRRDIWGATITFGPVVFQLFGSTVPELLEGVVMNTLNTHSIWPFRSSFTWMPRAGF